MNLKMNRPLKFRCWDVEEKQWINQHDWFIDQVGTVNIIDQSYQVGTYDKEVIITQFTGLFDFKGKEIWEGDIVELEYDITKNGHTFFKGRYIVKYFHGAFSIISPSGVWNLNDFDVAISAESVGDLKRIGNIFQSPQLLEGE